MVPNSTRRLGQHQGQKTSLPKQDPHHAALDMNTLSMCLHNISNSLRESRGTVIDEYPPDIELIYTFWRGGRQFGECAVKTLGTWQQPVYRNSPCSAF